VIELPGQLVCAASLPADRHVGLLVRLPGRIPLLPGARPQVPRLIKSLPGRGEPVAGGVKRGLGALPRRQDGQAAGLWPIARLAVGPCPPCARAGASASGANDSGDAEVGSHLDGPEEVQAERDPRVA